MGTPDINKLLTTSNTDKVGILNKLRSLFPDINEYNSNNTYRTGDIVYRIEGPELVIYTATVDNPDSTFNSSQWKDIRTIHMDLFRSSVLADMYMLNNNNAKPIPPGSNLSNYFDIPGTYYFEGTPNQYYDTPLEKRDDTTSRVKLIVEHAGEGGRENTVQRLLYSDGSEYFRPYNGIWTRSQIMYSLPHIIFNQPDFVIYVGGPNANDNTADGTREKPFSKISTILKFLSRDLNGRTVTIRVLGGGTVDTPGLLSGGFVIDNFYNGTLKIINDIVGTDISIVERAVITARGLHINGAVRIVNCSANIIMNDITLAGAAVAPDIAMYVPALTIEYSNNVELTRCVIDGMVYESGGAANRYISYGIETIMSSLQMNHSVIQQFESFGIRCSAVSKVVLNNMIFNKIYQAIIANASTVYLTKVTKTNVTVNYLTEYSGRIYEAAQSNIPIY